MRKLSINAMNASQQSQINISLIFNFLKDAGSANRSRIATGLALSIPAVSRSIDILEEKGFIVRAWESSSAARKGTPVYTVNASFGFVVAIDIFSIRTEAIVVDFSGQVKYREKGFNPEDSVNIPDDLKTFADRCINNFMSLTGEPKDKIKAIGLGVPAVVNRKTGTLMLSCYSAYESIDFVKLLQDRYGIPIFMENISALSALGEKRYGKRKSRETLVLIEIGAGIGSGILLDGSIYRGNGFAGEIGFSLSDSRDMEGSGKRATNLEKQASLSALKFNVLRELSLGGSSSLDSVFQSNQQLISPSLIFEHALNGDELCKNSISDMVNRISLTLHNMAVIVNPDAIIIGGDVCSMPGSDELLLSPIRRILNRTLPFSTPEISLSSLGDESGILGAATFAIDAILLRDFPYQQKNDEM